MFTYNNARSYLISGLEREAVSLGRTVASSIVLDHKGLFSLSNDNHEHTEVKNYLNHIYESNSTIRHINLILLNNQTPIPLLETGDSKSDEPMNNSKVERAIATGEAVYDESIVIVNNNKVMGTVVPIIRDGKMEGLVCVDLVADNLAAVLYRLDQYTMIISIILLLLVAASCYKFSEVLADRRELYSGSVNSLVDSIKAKDSYTGQHSLNVARYATLLAKELKLSSKDIHAVNLLARLHDIGKIGIRDDVLNKPSSLNQDELNSIRLHPVIGAQILNKKESIVKERLCK